MKFATELALNLKNSPQVKRWLDAFSETSRLPVYFAPAPFKDLGIMDQKHSNPFCKMVSATERGCGECESFQKRLAENTQTESTQFCDHGLVETTIPIQVDYRLIGYLQTGHIRIQEHVPKTVTRNSGLEKSGRGKETEAMAQLYEESPTLTQKEYDDRVEILKLIAAQIETFAKNSSVKEKGETTKIAQVIDYLKENFKKKISLETISKKVGISRFYLCKLFLKETGVNLLDYLNGLRLEYAKIELHAGEKKIANIALDSGFQSVPHFNQVFRKKVGVSPKQYLKQFVVTSK
ncbi:MAG: helix-turn-helix domain-containing protein [Verrucomicrobiota bacterium]